MSDALGKKQGLVVTSVKEEGRGMVYRIGPTGQPKLCHYGAMNFFLASTAML